MSYYGMDTEAVQAVGRNVFDLEPEADTAVTGVLNSYTEASGVVHHPVVTAAMSTYRETHQQGHLALAVAVRALGSNTANGGSTIHRRRRPTRPPAFSSQAWRSSRLARAVNERL